MYVYSSGSNISQILYCTGGVHAFLALGQEGRINQRTHPFGFQLADQNALPNEGLPFPGRDFIGNAPADRGSQIQGVYSSSGRRRSYSRRKRHNDSEKDGIVRRYKRQVLPADQHMTWNFHPENRNPPSVKRLQSSVKNSPVVIRKAGEMSAGPPPQGVANMPPKQVKDPPYQVSPPTQVTWLSEPSKNTNVQGSQPRSATIPEMSKVAVQQGQTNNQRQTITLPSLKVQEQSSSLIDSFFPQMQRFPSHSNIVSPIDNNPTKPGVSRVRNNLKQSGERNNMGAQMVPLMQEQMVTPTTQLHQNSHQSSGTAQFIPNNQSASQGGDSMIAGWQPQAGQVSSPVQKNPSNSMFSNGINGGLQVPRDTQVHSAVHNGGPVSNTFLGQKAAPNSQDGPVVVDSFRLPTSEIVRLEQRNPVTSIISSKNIGQVTPLKVHTSGFHPQSQVHRNMLLSKGGTKHLQMSGQEQKHEIGGQQHNPAITVSPTTNHLNNGNVFSHQAMTDTGMQGQQNNVQHQGQTRPNSQGQWNPMHSAPNLVSQIHEGAHHGTSAKSTPTRGIHMMESMKSQLNRATGRSEHPLANSQGQWNPMHSAPNLVSQIHEGAHHGTSAKSTPTRGIHMMESMKSQLNRATGRSEHPLAGSNKPGIAHSIRKQNQNQRIIPVLPPKSIRQQSVMDIHPTKTPVLPQQGPLLRHSGPADAINMFAASRIPSETGGPLAQTQASMSTMITLNSPAFPVSEGDIYRQIQGLTIKDLANTNFTRAQILNALSHNLKGPDATGAQNKKLTQTQQSQDFGANNPATFINNEVPPPQPGATGMFSQPVNNASPTNTLQARGAEKSRSVSMANNGHVQDIGNQFHSSENTRSQVGPQKDIGIKFLATNTLSSSIGKQFKTQPQLDPSVVQSATSSVNSHNKHQSIDNAGSTQWKGGLNSEVQGLPNSATSTGLQGNPLINFGKNTEPASQLIRHSDPANILDQSPTHSRQMQQALGQLNQQNQIDLDNLQGVPQIINEQALRPINPHTSILPGKNSARNTPDLLSKTAHQPVNGFIEKRNLQAHSRQDPKGKHAELGLTLNPRQQSLGNSRHTSISQYQQQQSAGNDSFGNDIKALSGTFQNNDFVHQPNRTINQPNNIGNSPDAQVKEKAPVKSVRGVLVKHWFFPEMANMFSSVASTVPTTLKPSTPKPSPSLVDQTPSRNGRRPSGKGRSKSGIRRRFKGRRRNNRGKGRRARNRSRQSQTTINRSLSNRSRQPVETINNPVSKRPREQPMTINRSVSNRSRLALGTINDPQGNTPRQFQTTITHSVPNRSRQSPGAINDPVGSRPRQSPQIIPNKSRQSSAAINDPVPNKSSQASAAISDRVPNRSSQTSAAINDRVPNRSSQASAAINDRVPNRSKQPTATFNKSVGNRSKLPPQTINDSVGNIPRQSTMTFDNSINNRLRRLPSNISKSLQKSSELNKSDSKQESKLKRRKLNITKETRIITRPLVSSASLQTNALLSQIMKELRKSPTTPSPLNQDINAKLSQILNLLQSKPNPVQGFNSGPSTSLLGLTQLLGGVSTVAPSNQAATQLSPLEMLFLSNIMPGVGPSVGGNFDLTQFLLGSSGNGALLAGKNSTGVRGQGSTNTTLLQELLVQAIQSNDNSK